MSNNCMHQEVLNLVALLTIEGIHLQHMLRQPLACSDPDVNSVIFIASMHIYLLEAGPIRTIRNQCEIDLRYYLGHLIIHLMLIYISLVLVWDPSGCLLEHLLAYSESLKLSKYLHLCRLAMALTFFLCSHLKWGQEREIYTRTSMEAIVPDLSCFHPIWGQSEIKLGSLGLHYKHESSRQLTYDELAREFL